MMLTLVVVMLKDRFCYTFVHSNHHHLKIVKALAPYFKYDWIGNEVGRHLPVEEVFNKINKNNNPDDATRTIKDWSRGKDLRSLKGQLECLSGYILIDYTGYEVDYMDEEIYINIATTENSSEEEENLMIEQFKYRFRSIIRRRNWLR